VGRIRFSPTVIYWGWRLWRAVAVRPGRRQLREGALAAFGPVMVPALLLTWGFVLALGYALVFTGLKSDLRPAPEDFGTTLYLSAGTLLSFTVGGIEATGVATRILVALEAATGFGLFALVISLLFSLFSSFQRRESAVVALDALAGAPPSGVQLLESCADVRDQLTATFIEWRDWTVDVLESHLSYPLLIFFRSSHDNEAWPNSFAAVMDAASLVLSVIEDGPTGQARLMYKVGAHLVDDIVRYYRHPNEPMPAPDRSEFLQACARLSRAGYRIREGDDGWREFASLRNAYLPWLELTVRVLAITPTKWIGDPIYSPHSDREL
jgi:hypothetical protein